jgi:hypothetical protein
MYRCIILLVLIASVSGCADPREVPSADRSVPAGLEGGTAAEAAADRGSHEPDILLTDITESSGLAFRHFNDASANRYLPETMGAGAALFDYDNDGRPDLYLVNGAPLTGSREGARHGMLARNIDGTSFRDVTWSTGLTEPLYGMGATVGDIENDGHLDLFVTALPENRLYRNRGDGTFQDVTAAMGFSGSGFSTAAVFLDYDRDGWQDLLVGRYVHWDPQTDTGCSYDGTRRIYCTPEVYPGQSNRLYRNLGGQSFRDVTEAAGIYRPEGKTLGIAVLDANNDGWPDVAISNDTVRNFLFINNGDGTFDEAARDRGVAYGESGSTHGGYGISAGDINGDGLTDLAIGRFSLEMTALYRATPQGYYIDDAFQAGVGIPTLTMLSFGTILLDLDSDGWLDLVHANGHIEPRISRVHSKQTYPQPPQFFRNLGNGEFELVQSSGAASFITPLVGRGLASADLDGDGDLDLVITQNGRRTRVLRNDSAPRSWIRIKLSGVASNRTGFGAVVRAVAGENVWTRSLASGGSYLSASEPILTIGLGETESLDRLEITWPSGKVQTVTRPEMNRLHTIEEPSP